MPLHRHLSPTATRQLDEFADILRAKLEAAQSLPCGAACSAVESAPAIGAAGAGRACDGGTLVLSLSGTPPGPAECRQLCRSIGATYAHVTANVRRVHDDKRTHDTSESHSAAVSGPDDAATGVTMERRKRARDDAAGGACLAAADDHGGIGEPNAVDRDAALCIECRMNEAFARLRAYLPFADCAQVVRLARSAWGADDQAPRRAVRFLLPSGADRSQRRELHHVIRALFGRSLRTRTEADGEQRWMRVYRSAGGGRFKEAGGARSDVYVHFTLEKRGIEHLAALCLLADSVGVPLSHLAAAGTKDSRAHSWQRCSIRMPQQLASRFASLVRSAPSCIQVHDVTPADGPVRLGQLQGNVFRILLHYTGPVSEEQLAAATAAVRDRGFVNYYGPQRFGLPTSAMATSDRGCDIGGDATVDGQSVPVTPQPSAMPSTVSSSVLQSTARAGLYILRRQDDEAVRTLLSPMPLDGSDVLAAKAAFRADGAADAALRRLPHRCCVRERLLLAAMRRFGHTQPAQALLALPHAARLLYVHAYAALVWNEMASWRTMQYGLRVVPGDLLASGLPSSSVSHMDTICVDEGAPHTAEVTICADAEAARRASIFEVVLPVVGHRVQLPTNGMAEVYRRRLAVDGLSLTTPDTFRRRDLGINMAGAYRRLLARPSDLRCTAAEGASFGGDAAACLPFWAEFTLPPGAYATMCLRELLAQLGGVIDTAWCNDDAVEPEADTTERLA